MARIVRAGSRPMADREPSAGSPRHADTSLLRSDLRLAGRLDARFFAVLRALDSTGSLNKAAKAAGYSYKGAWLLLEAAAGLARTPLIAKATGGRGGGGSRLTEAGRQLLAAWEELQVRHAAFLQEQEAWLLERSGLSALRRIAMKTSARNQFAGIVSQVSSGPATTQVTIVVSGGFEITASVTTGAAERLKIAVGQNAIALVKASEVVLITDFAGYRLSARNQLAGTISRVEKGAVSSLIGVALPGGTVVTASVTNDAVDALGLAVGQAATATFKAHAVMVAVPV